VKSLTPAYLTEAISTNGELSPQVVSTFRAMVYAYYHDNPRRMAWRETADPYHILVSEIMLQQTQVERVRVKYSEFLSAFPTVHELAAAPLSDVLRVWQGLGYNRRAMFLKRCSEEIVTRYAGQFPCTIDLLETLPGIGPYTARAVAAFAFGEAEPMIETNIRTLYIHFFFHDREKVSDSEIMPLVAATLDLDNPRQWYYALMDYGVMLKKTHPNPGRRSRHHTMQSRFEGSNRQLRSRLLRAILEKPGIRQETLLTITLAGQESVERNLEALEQEGFLVKQGYGYRVAGEKKEGNAPASPPLFIAT
jgi:A/G-specific adenine glycosylase